MPARFPAEGAVIRRRDFAGAAGNYDSPTGVVPIRCRSHCLPAASTRHTRTALRAAGAPWPAVRSACVRPSDATAAGSPTGGRSSRVSPPCARGRLARARLCAFLRWPPRPCPTRAEWGIGAFARRHSRSLRSVPTPHPRPTQVGRRAYVHVRATASPVADPPPVPPVPRGRRATRHRPWYEGVASPRAYLTRTSLQSVSTRGGST